MQFYFKKPHQDRLYLKIITTINLSYWIASDAHHYASEHTKEVNKYEYDRLKSQYNLAINLFTEGQDLIHFLEGDHAECANLVSRHIGTKIQSNRHVLSLYLLQQTLAFLTNLLQIIDHNAYEVD